MTNQTSSALQRSWPRRTGVLAAATLVLSLSSGAGAHADGGLIDDVTGVVGEATQQVPPVVETVQSTVPPPVPEVVEHVVEQLVDPTVAQVEQTLEAVPGADRAGEPVKEVVEAIVRQPEEPADEPAAENVDPIRSAQAPVAPQDPVAAQGVVPGGPAGSHPASGSGHPGPGAASTGAPHDDEVAWGTGACDLPPRATAVSAMVRHPGGGDGPSADRTAWNPAHSLMQLWAGGAALPRWGTDRPEDRTSGARASHEPEGRAPAVPVHDTMSVARMLGVLLLGMFGMLVAAGLAVFLTQQDEQPA